MNKFTLTADNIDRPESWPGRGVRMTDKEVNKTKVCQNCGQMFEHRRYSANRFCSKRCSTESWGKKQDSNDRRK